MLIVLLLLTFSIRASAQAQQKPQQDGQSESSSQSQSPVPDKKADDAAMPKTTASQTPSSEARQAQFVADSQKLYQLAQELKTEVAKSDKNTLSIAVTKKAEEIEKLAKSLKERMRKE